MTGVETEPKLRHEFVGMMFAVTIGEVGLQVASLVQAKHYSHYLPFYFHLLLATAIITSSWVGWSLSQSPGARRDVTGVFTWGFVTLLLDVFLVVTYFIIVRTIEVGKGKESSRIDPPELVAWWMFFMFVLYLVWDIITKVIAYDRSSGGSWFRDCGVRMIPTLICVPSALLLRSLLKGADLVHYISADAALLGLALMFRSLKDVVSEGFPRSGRPVDRFRIGKAIKFSIFWVFVISLSTISTKRSWSILPAKIMQDINTPIIADSSADSKHPAQASRVEKE